MSLYYRAAMKGEFFTSPSPLNTFHATCHGCWSAKMAEAKAQVSFWLGLGLYTATDVTSDLIFEISDLNYLCWHAFSASKCQHFKIVVRPFMTHWAAYSYLVAAKNARHVQRGCDPCNDIAIDQTDRYRPVWWSSGKVMCGFLSTKELTKRPVLAGRLTLDIQILILYASWLLQNLKGSTTQSCTKITFPGCLNLGKIAFSCLQ